MLAVVAAMTVLAAGCTAAPDPEGEPPLVTPVALASAPAGASDLPSAATLATEREIPSAAPTSADRAITSADAPPEGADDAPPEGAADPSPNRAADEPAFAAGDAPIGVQIFEDDTTTDAILRVRAAGATWARTRALWKLVEPEPGRYDWTVTDALFGDTTAAGLRNIAAVYANPPWAATTECGAPNAAGRARWAALWSALVERYDGDGVDDAPGGGEVRWWQVGNEVDFDAAAAGAEGDYGTCLGDQPEVYADLLAEARAAAKAADPAVMVGFGPVAWDRFTAASAPDGWTAPPGPYVYDFTERALEALARRAAPPLVDFIGLHHYNDNAHAWDGAAGRELVARVARFRDAQLALPGVYDVRGLPLVISETGLAAGPSDEYTERSEAHQAAYAAQVLVRARAAGVAMAVWYTARDNLFGDCLPPHWDWLAFGLMRSDDRRDALAARCPGTTWDGAAWADDYALSDGPATPRPALRALAATGALLRGRAFDGTVDVVAAPGQSAVEAYRFRDAEGRALVVAWATTGARIGARTLPPPSAEWRVDAAVLDGWTGRVAVTDHLGGRVTIGQPGQAAVLIALGEGPVAVAVAAGTP